MSSKISLRSEVQRFCASIARDRMLVQAAGGNVSWKSANKLWIKASGTWLEDAEKNDIFVPVDLNKINSSIKKGDYSVQPKALDGYKLRPSIETLLHALMPHKFVVHLHPVAAVAHLVRSNCETTIHAAISDNIKWELVNYFKPGAELAQAVFLKLQDNKNIQVIFLKNHGVIIGGETLIEIESLLLTLTACLDIQPQHTSTVSVDYEITNAASLLKDTSYQICNITMIHDLVNEPQLYKSLVNSWALYPDHVVFLGQNAICINDLEKLRPTLLSLNTPPPFVFVKNKFVLQHSKATNAQIAQLNFFLDVIIRQPKNNFLDVLTKDNIESLLNWDAEKYRQSINA